MELQVTYVIPLENMSTFTHLKTNRLQVTVDTNTVDNLEEFKAKIAHAILRDYGICIQSFDEGAVPYWEKLEKTAQKEIYSRLFYEAVLKANSYNEAYAKIKKQMEDMVSDAFKNVKELNDKLNSLSEGELP